MGKLFSLFSVPNAIVKKLTDFTFNVRMGISQCLYLILEALNLPSGFYARVAEAADLAEGLVRTVVVKTVLLGLHKIFSSSMR